jgi:hypothetical protein
MQAAAANRFAVAVAVLRPLSAVSKDEIEWDGVKTG